MLTHVKHAHDEPGIQPGPSAAPRGAGPFDYLFPDSPEASGDAAALDSLAAAMLRSPPPAVQNAPIAAVYTYLGQFVDHDITAGTDREDGLSVIDTETVTPVPRDKVARDRRNLRTARLDLDSLYGDGPDDSAFAQRLAGLLRHPVWRAKMWLGTPVGTRREPTSRDPGTHCPPLPRDIAGDLLRLGRLLHGPNAPLTEADIRALPEAERQTYELPNGDIRVQRAIIGDARNDENLAIAQLHLAFLRFHNRLVDENGLGDTSDEAFEAARRLVRWHYQWLVIHDFLKQVCDPQVVAATLADEAPVYRAFAAHRPAEGALPLPLEFSVAAFRFGHSMVRAGYDWNCFGGIGLQQMFALTGNRDAPMSDGGVSFPRLPAHRIVDWARLIDVSVPARRARSIDTDLAVPLGALSGESDRRTQAVLDDLPRRNLRRGLRLNLPSAQDCIVGFARHGVAIDPLGAADLLTGPTAAAVEAGGFETSTPLWFYVLKEAEVQRGGDKLGQLGSRIVAETLIGLIVCDGGSFWHQPGSDRGRWHARDGLKPNGAVVETIADLLRAAGVL